MRAIRDVHLRWQGQGRGRRVCSGGVVRSSAVRPHTWGRHEVTCPLGASPQGHQGLAQRAHRATAKAACG
eukprot:2611292-Prymnesium_polylepis.1